MLPSLRPITSFLSTRIADSYNYLTDSEVARGEKYAVLRHSRPFIIYRGTKTSLTVTVLGDSSFPKDRRVFLQRRGYRTALLGWSIGTVLGGSYLPGIEVTPVERGFVSSLPSSVTKDIARLCPDLRALETLTVHIPVASGDGYFRLRITKSDGRTAIAHSPAFRVGSLSLSSAHPQGATLMGLIPELTVRTTFLGFTASAYAAFYAAFPLLKIAEWTPGPWKQYAVRALYSHTLSPEQQERVQRGVAQGRQGFSSAQAGMTRRIPFGAVGVRTDADLIKDDELGRGGVSFDHARS
ncbi:hypothetical protein EXIGLDRAFT_741850 [Exidia glandulosa HHB12029]|uniref:Uncharacterized protein n=1 Tax=Exidia glandulosa HHB12029 TaxID=1314781 RepID=A0A165DKE0_EXIGL|nr:hypothetical protein EXIGLDRAFT_741850 [Exidia glandulosa HHB12029]